MLKASKHQVQLNVHQAEALEERTYLLRAFQELYDNSFRAYVHYFGHCNESRQIK